MFEILGVLIIVFFVIGIIFCLIICGISTEDDTSSSNKSSPKNTSNITAQTKNTTKTANIPAPSQTSVTTVKNAEQPKDSRPDWVKELDSPKWEKVSESKSDSGFAISTYTRSYYEVIRQKTQGMLQMADIGGYVSPSGGYVNYCRYSVTGIRYEGKSKRTWYFECFDEIEARELAISNGFIEPFIIELAPSEKPTERQIEYANALEAQFPADVCFHDISSIISRITDNDEEAPYPGVSRYAHKHKVRFSRFIGRRAMLNAIAYQLKGFDLALFYAHAVYVKQIGKELGDPCESDVYPELKIAAESVLKDFSLMESLYKRKGSDYLSPSKNTKIYRAIIESLQKSGII